MVWEHMVHQTLPIQWFDGPRLTTRYVYNGLGTHGSPHITKTWIWKSMAHQTLRIQLFLYTWLTKLYKYNGVMAHGSPNITHTVVWEHRVHQTWQIQWFECPWLTTHYVNNGFGNTWLTKQYKCNCLSVRGSPNVTYTLVRGHMAHQTIQIQWFDGPWLTKRYIYNCFGGLLTKPYKYMSLNING